MHRPRILKSLRHLPGDHFKPDRIPAEFIKFYDEQITPRLQFTGYKLAEQHRTARHCIHSLVMAGLRGHTVIDTRDNSNRLRVKVWDAIADARLCVRQIGSEQSAKRTRYLASNKLLDLRKSWRLGDLVDLRLSRNSESNEPSEFALVVLKVGEKGNRRAVSLAAAIRSTARNKQEASVMMQQLRISEDQIDRINTSNLGHSWVAFGFDHEAGKYRAFPPNPCVRLIHSQQLNRCARLHSWSAMSGQSLPEASRIRMLIDGEQSVELDFKCLHLSILYSLEGEEIGGGDLYKPGEVFPCCFNPVLGRKKLQVLRGFVKQATINCLNTSSRGRANSSVGKLLKEHEQSKFLYKVLDFEHIGPKEVVDRIVAAHPLLHGRFFNETINSLMTVDGWLMLHILLKFVRAEKPALPVHDSLVVRKSDWNFAWRVMRETYEEFFPGTPRISISGGLKPLATMLPKAQKLLQKLQNVA